MRPIATAYNSYISYHSYCSYICYISSLYRHQSYQRT